MPESHHIAEKRAAMEAASLGKKTVPWRPMTEDEVARASELFRTGLKPAWIAMRLSKSKGAPARGAQEVREALEAIGLDVPDGRAGATGNNRGSGRSLDPKKVAEILHLHDTTELTGAQIATRVGVTDTTARKHLRANGRTARNGKAGRPHEHRRAEDGRPWGKTQWQYDLDMAVVATSKCARCPWEHTGPARELAQRFREHECAAEAEAA